jgi:hypothetical protein
MPTYSASVYSVDAFRMLVPTLFTTMSNCPYVSLQMEAGVTGMQRQKETGVCACVCVRERERGGYVRDLSSFYHHTICTLSHTTYPHTTVQHSSRRKWRERERERERAREEGAGGRGRGGAQCQIQHSLPALCIAHIGLHHLQPATRCRPLQLD